LSKQLNKALSDFGFNSPYRVSVASEPFHWRMLKLVKEDIMVYDCSDDYTKLSPNQKPEKTYSDEAKLAGQVHLCFATAKSLFDRLSQFNKNVHYIPNGVDIDLYCNDRISMDIPQDIGSIRHPIIGFMGNLNHWYDIELIFNVASIKKGWNFVFVGTTGSGIEKGIASLRSLPNCHFLGWKDRLLLPAYLRCFDAAIMPYKTGELTEAINPGKLYQYMASGLPIVSTPIPEALGYKDLIEIASTPQDFMGALEKILKSGYGYKKERLVEEAKKHSWAQRAKQKDILIDNELGKASHAFYKYRREQQNML
jgi:glycosyltransferase involved in cell wall biosynthesis